MPQAAPLPQPPPGESVFGAACAWLQEEAGLVLEQAQLVVLGARTHCRAAYDDCLGASRPAELTPALRAALHAQARVVVGEEQAEPLRVLGPASLPASEDELLDLASPSQGPPAAPAAAPRRSTRAKPNGPPWHTPLSERPQPLLPRQPAVGMKPNGKQRGAAQ